MGTLCSGKVCRLDSQAGRSGRPDLDLDAYREIVFDIRLTPLVQGKDNQIVHRPRVSLAA